MATLYDVNHHGQLALIELRSTVLKEMCTNSYTGPRLRVVRASNTEREHYESQNTGWQSI